ncbi:integrator complex subunit 11 [Phyllostomus discolor]|uniref:Integrator complex subunit 11 n=1 Tax=Phyllostomus discolor TaxID=89673 RepID=A0A834E632_9CHIR|nr:integrator complex subunit 11 [Phyllostomus discolor]
MPEIRVTPLGAGQDVGRSCILVSIGGKNVMLDCGMHMGFNDDRRFPDFSYITRNGRLTDFLDCVIISHFHLDHCGALPYFSEMVGYDGPIYMTHPTQAICPILLEDYRKIAVDKKGEANFFTSQMIKDCMKKVVAVHLHQTVLLETFWERMNLKAPIYFSTGLTEKANHYYKLFITWTNQKIRKTFVQRNMFEFKHIKAFDRAFADNPGPMVVFATPGMLHAGQSLQIFRKWAGNEKNMVIMPGYCVQGTVGHKILSGQRKLEMEGRQVLEVRMQVEYMSFSAHADAKGIMQLNFRLVSSEQALKELGLAEHQLRFTCRVHLHDTRKEQETAVRVYSHLKGLLKDHCVQHLPDGSVTVESILIQAAAHSEDPGTKVLLVSWTYQDEELGSYLTSLLKKGLPPAPSGGS